MTRDAYKYGRTREVDVPFVILGPPNDCSMMTLRPDRNLSNISGLCLGRRTFWSEGNADSVGEDIDTLENAGSALVGKLNFLVGRTG